MEINNYLCWTIIFIKKITLLWKMHLHQGQKQPIMKILVKCRQIQSFSWASINVLVHYIHRSYFHEQYNNYDNRLETNTDIIWRKFYFGPWVGAREASAASLLCDLFYFLRWVSNTWFYDRIFRLKLYANKIQQWLQLTYYFSENFDFRYLYLIIGIGLLKTKLMSCKLRESDFLESSQDFWDFT